VLLACFTVDYRVLFEPLTEEIVQDGFQYYKTFYNAPLGIKVRKCFMPAYQSAEECVLFLFYFIFKTNKTNWGGGRALH
jgi:hypothetical protein